MRAEPGDSPILHAIAAAVRAAEKRRRALVLHSPVAMRQAEIIRQEVRYWLDRL